MTNGSTTLGIKLASMIGVCCLPRPESKVVDEIAALRKIRTRLREGARFRHLHKGRREH